ncbi:MAG: TldD/PmbA family protein [Bacilli bacterium]|nr:TldD/PmbA family protein [Bacilli bacterium]
MTYNELFELAQNKGFNNIQVTEETKKENSIYLINKKIEDYTDCEKTTYTVKAEKDGKTEQIYTEYLDESIVDLLLEKILETESKYEDTYLDINKNNTIDEEVNIDIKEELELLKNLNYAKEKYEKVQSLETAYSDTYTKTRIVNNKGVDIATSSRNYELYVEASAKENDKIATYSESTLSSNKKEINIKRIVENALTLATLGTKKKRLENKKYNIVLNNKVASFILNELQKMLSAEAVHQKKTCLENKKYEKVFSNKLTIVEEPLNKKYPGYTIFDKEGTNTINKILIENGTIKNYLYDIKEAIIDKVESTGNKYNGIGTRNMFIVPGKKSLEELFNEMQDGIYITNYLGSMGSSINISSGNISFQVFGYIIENGKLVSGFEPAVITTSIFELFSNIEDIGNDLKFSTRTVASPSLYIKEISISGE